MSMLSAKKQLKAPLLDEAPLSASVSASASGRSATSFSTSKNSSSASDSDSSENDSYPRRTSGFMDGMGFVHCLCFCLGISALLPWFSFITSAGYFRSRFCGSSVETNFLSFFSLAYNISNAATQALQLQYYQSLVPLLRIRVYGSLFLILALCLLTTAFVLQPDISAMTLFYLSLASIGLCGALVACYSGGLFAVLGTLPGPVTQTFIAGQGLAGFGVSIVSLVTIAVGPEDDTFCTDSGDDDGEEECTSDIDYSALAFFCTSCFVVLLAVLSFYALENLPITMQCRDKARKDRMNSISYIGGDSTTMISDHVSKLQDEHDNMDQPQEDLDEQGDTKAISPPDGGSQSKYVRVYQQVKVPAWSVFLTFTITLSLFPAITVLIISQNECEDGASRFSNDLFIPFVFCLFNSCDFIGRLLARRLKEWVTVSNMWIPTFLRVAFFPLILLCDVEGTVLPVIFLHDSWPIVIICLFGLTNGSLVSLAMMSGPAMVAPRHSSLAATFMLFALTLGLCSGSCLSFIMLYISQGSFQ